jgi:predicted nucleic acid-binding protein
VTPVLLDTSCIVALLDRSERNHAACVAVIEDVQGPLATCEAVIAEACYLLRRMPGAADAVVENVERGAFQIPFDLTAAAHGVRRLLRRYRNVPMDLADACLVHVATELGTGDILTLDDDFDVYRWGKNRPFARLIRRAR